jgi:hypothetical protein
MEHRDAFALFRLPSYFDNSYLRDSFELGRLNMIVALLFGMPSTLTLKRPMQPMRQFHTIRHMVDDSDQLIVNDFGGRLNSPAIFSKQLLFGNGNSEVLSSNDDLESTASDDGNDFGPKKRLKGTSASVEPKCQLHKVAFYEMESVFT